MFTGAMREAPEHHVGLSRPVDHGIGLWLALATQVRSRDRSASNAFADALPGSA
jgi:hypothetical protein